MGCCKSKGATYDVPADNNRSGPTPTLGNLDDDGYPETTDRQGRDIAGLLLELNGHEIEALVKARELDKARRYSMVWTQTDTAMQKVPSFFPKELVLTGTDFDPTKDALGYACRKGLKPDHPNQDSFFMVKIEGDLSIHGVFDGHGRNGHDVSNFIRNNLPKLLLLHPELRENPLKALEDSFEDMQQLIVHAHRTGLLDAQRSGSTATVILIDHRKKSFHVSHVGDSRCVLAQKAARGGVQAVDVTIDHKPDLPEERARIEAAGGKVVYDGFINHRVYSQKGKGPGLNMSRALGDLTGYYDAGISATPDVNTIPVNRPISAPSSNGEGTPEHKKDIKGEERLTSKEIMKAAGAVSTSVDMTFGQGTSSLNSQCLAKNNLRRTESLSSNQSYKFTGKDQFILICSDGVWEFISSQEAAEIVHTFPMPEAMAAADELTKQAWNLWIEKFQGQIVDDITALVINLTR